MSTPANPDWQIAIAAHKPYRMPQDACYLPIHVGATLHPDVCVDMQQDNEGENISEKNGEYSELTALYWLWKNSDAKHKGLVHYRRHFCKPGVRRAADAYDRIADAADFQNVFSETGTKVILPKSRNYVIETIGSHYRHTHPGEHLDVIRDILSKDCPEYLPVFDSELKGTKAHMFNMLVAEAPVFDAYCAWLFPLLADLEKQLKDRRYDAFAARYPGRISEILLDTWLETNGIAWAEMPVVSPEPIDWPAKAKGFLAAKFFGKKYERSF